MVIGQISSKMARREFSISITFSDAYTCTYVELIPIKIGFFMNFQNSFKLECVTITEMREDTTTFISLCGFVNSAITVSLFLILLVMLLLKDYTQCVRCVVMVATCLI